MSTLARASLFPRSLRELHRQRTFASALKKFTRDPALAAQLPSATLESLVYGWGNAGWSGHSEFLSACVVQALRSEGPMLECGTGLSTLLVGIVAQARGQALWSLEHLPEWAQRVQQALERHEISSVQICVQPLRSYGEFDWYAPPLETMPAGFSLIICDGPPSATRGGRYGLAPMVSDRMLPGCTVLLDDAVRSDEQQIAARWAKEFGLQGEQRGVDKPYFVLRARAATMRPHSSSG
jgi:hypothetical protein